MKRLLGPEPKGQGSCSKGSVLQELGDEGDHGVEAFHAHLAVARELGVAGPAQVVAEGEVEFTSSDYNIVTGISDLNMDGNREVMSVSYVNTIGQASSKPWQGVNIVVTRYSDGSVVTRKEVK